MTTPEIALPQTDPDPIPAPAPPAEHRNPFQVLLGVILKPRSTFAYLRDHGGWAWLIPLALLIVLTLASRAIAVPIETAQREAAIAAIQEQLAGNGGEGTFTFSSAGPGMIIGNGGTEPNPASEAFFAYGLPVLQSVGGWLVATILLLILAWIFGGRPSITSMFRMSAWAALPFVVRLVIIITVMIITQRIPVQGMMQAFQPQVTGEVQTIDGAGTEKGEGPVRNVVTFGPGPGGSTAFAGPVFGSLFVNNLLMNLDIYTVWSTLLLAVGVTVTARLAWFKGVLVTILYVLLALSLSTLPTLISFALGGLMMGGGGGPVMRP
jgi:hypothetical protein